MPLLRRLVRSVSLGGLLALVACGGGGGTGGGGYDVLSYVLDPAKTHYGASFALWSERWWQWIYELPRTHHPAFDPTGADAWRGQVDPVWFVCGEIGSLFAPSDGHSERTIQIPSGRAIFFPTLCVSWTNQECVDPDTTFSYTQLRKFAADAIEATTDILCTVDGVRIIDAPNMLAAARFRAQSEEFSYTLPADNIYVDICGDPAMVTLHAPVASDGIWVMLDPLPVGHHEISWSGKFHGVAGDSTVDVIYHIDVVP